MNDSNDTNKILQNNNIGSNHCHQNDANDNDNKLV